MLSGLLSTGTTTTVSVLNEEIRHSGGGTEAPHESLAGCGGGGEASLEESLPLVCLKVDLTQQQQRWSNWPLASLLVLAHIARGIICSVAFCLSPTHGSKCWVEENGPRETRSSFPVRDLCP